MAIQAPHSRGEKLFFWSEKQIGKSRDCRSGEIRAQSEQHARFLLRKQGVKPKTIRQIREFITAKASLAVVASFVRQLSVMIQSGVPLGQSLGLISNNLSGSKNRSMRNLVRIIRADVESGSKLSDAMRKHPKCFDAIFCNILAAGEESGELDSVLMRLANHLEKVIRTRQKLRKAMTYPSIVVVIALAVSVGLLAFVIPTFRAVYSSFKTELPWLTTVLLDLSDLITKNGVTLIASMVLFCLSFSIVYRRFDKFRHYVDQLLLRTPIIGELIRTAIHARWARTFSTLNASGVPIVGALESVAQVCGNKSYHDATMLIRQEVATGSTVSDCMGRAKLFPPDAVQMVRIGEESGRLDQMLDRLAAQFEVKLDDMVDNLSTVIEPAIMSLIGVIVGTLIIGMYLPIFNIGGIF